MSEMMTGAEMVVRALQDQGVEHLFGYPGGVADRKSPRLNTRNGKLSSLAPSPSNQH